MEKFPYSDTNKRYHTLDYDMKKQFGQKVYKVPIDGGFTCPNIDGRAGVGGCIYCSGRGSGDFAPNRLLPLAEQYALSRRVYLEKAPHAKFIAYFQAHSNTYASLSVLQEKFEAALLLPDVVGIDIATRADCLEDDVVDYLFSLKERTHLTVELGLQTIHDKTAAYINRGHDFETFLKGYEKLKGLRRIVHLIQYLPGESEEMMLDSVKTVGNLLPYGVKLHMLYVMKGTRLAEDYQNGLFTMPSREDYVSLIAEVLCYLPREIVIARLTGDAPRESLIAPLWSRNKIALLNEIDKEMAKRKRFQGDFVKNAQKQE